MAQVFTLTPGAAAQALRNNGLDALGLTMLRLWPAWSNSALTFDASQLTLTPAGGALAPFRGTLEFLDNGAEFRDIAGAPITGPVAAFRLHPQAVARLERLVSEHLSPPALGHHTLIPETLVFRGAVPMPDRSPQTWEPGEALNRTDAMSFHDNRGLIIDPIAVAALFAELMTTYPALDASDGAGMGGGGDLTAITALATGILMQLTDLHGRAFTPLAGGPGVEIQTTGGTQVGTPGTHSTATLAADQQLAGTGDNAAARLRLGWCTGGIMAAGPLQAPALRDGVTLPRRFLRAFVTDLDWHLRGNRSATAVRGVPEDDQSMPPDLIPAVRDAVTIDYHPAGPDLLAVSGQVLNRLAGAGDGALFFAVAPVMEPELAVPAQPGDQARWPAYPGPDTGNAFAPNGTSPLSGATAAWTSGDDVVVTLGADLLPAGTFVRLYSRRFELITSIGAAPSFVRGDGGAALVEDGAAVQILVHNPLGLAPGDPHPGGAVLVFDLVVVPRVGQRRMYANRQLDIDDGPAPVPDSPFTADPSVLAMVPDAMRSVAPAPLFGIPRSGPPPAGSPSGVVDVVRALGQETEPRQGPRHPTMGRLESIVVSGIPDTDQLSQGLMWEGVLSGARWAPETRSNRFRDANPGNPAGPDTHVAGVKVTGTLAYDLARHAVRRVQPILPLPGGASSTTSPGWIVMSGGNNMNPPAPDDDTPPPAGSSSGVLLQTVAAICETPELSLLPPGNPFASNTPISLDQVLDTLTDALGIPSVSGSIDVSNGDRLLNEIRREYFLASHGARDALWSLSRVLREADELVYIETPGFARTARPDGTPAAHEIDLVTVLAERMASQPNLKVIVVTPRQSDLIPAPFARRAYVQRLEAYGILKAVDPNRVVMFHPRGFPGRHARVRSTTVVVDDVWSLTGATHFRRRGMTFDGSAAIASFDRDIVQGYSRKVRDQRIALMAACLELSPVDADGLPVPAYQRLHRPASAFGLIRDLLAQGGLGVLSPLWHGPTDDTVLPQSDNVADPDGRHGAPGDLTLASFLSEA